MTNCQEIIKLTPENIPDVEVIAIGYQNECLVGYISKIYGDYVCESSSEELKDITHFMFIPKMRND
jgi:hypothetical protein